MKKYVLITLLAFAMAVGTASAAKTVVVKADGTGDTNTLEKIATMVTAGDVIEIADGSVYSVPATINLDGVTIKGSTKTRPTIKLVGTTGVILQVNNCTVDNINFEGQGSTWQQGVVCTGTFTVRRCNFSKFWTADPIVLRALNNIVLQGTVEYCMTLGNKGHMVTFHGWWPADVKPTAANLGPIVINHCTITFGGPAVKAGAGDDGGYGIFIDKAYPTDGDNIVVKNSIVGYTRTWDGVAHDTQADNFFYASACPYLSDKLTQPLIQHHHNIYTSKWFFMPYAFGEGDGGMFLEGSEPGADEVLLGNDSSTPEGTLFKELEPADSWCNGMLMPNTSVALWKADDGMNIGADVATTPVELSTFQAE